MWLLLDKSHYIPSLMNAKQDLFHVYGDDGFYNCRIKYYDDTIKICVFNKKIFNPEKLELHKTDKQILLEDKKKEHFKSLRENTEPQKRTERSDAIKRAKDKVFEIAFANRFFWFITLTIDETKLSRTDKDQILKKLNTFLSNQVQRHNLKYIIIPEYHTKTEDNGEKAIHLHGLISGENLGMSDSGKTYKNKKIFYWNDWVYGFSSAIMLDGQKHICNYITKYITKGNKKIFGRYYLSGGKINRQVPTEHCNVDYETFDGREYEIIPNKIKVKYLTITNKEKKHEEAKD